MGQEQITCRKTEEPDYLVSIDGQDIGIEITRFFSAPEPGEKSDQELDGLGELSIGVAKSLFKEVSELALYVSVHFARRPESKREAYDLAKRVAAAVLNTVNSPIGYDWHTELPEVAGLDVWPSIDGVDELWQGGMGGFVRVVHPPAIQAVLDAKNGKLAQYRRKVKTVWLGIVHDIFRGGALCELDPEATEHVFQSSYDKVFWVDVQKPAAYELRI